ncbi:GNAT family N-acetyltransferase [Amycolatopsis palatopharyngis]|uniref:GNAT family N-acetyltransferase n=1 Tax=Amycolatopsis palatopharyngis TaxID=187982 RepID=UPI000E24FD38|nr:GNAT family N-acetyltransferase [Amycolatopsis palatopharyngis]
MALAPAEIRTQRLLLRWMSDADVPALVRIHADPETNRHNPRGPTEERSRELIAGFQRHWKVHGFGYWTVREAVTGTVIGAGGVQTKEHDGERVLNLYYRLAPRYWGQGFASEMAAAAVEWAEREIPDRPVVIVTDVDNAQAQRVAEKLGFREHKRGPYGGADAVYYRRR